MSSEKLTVSYKVQQLKEDDKENNEKVNRIEEKKTDNEDLMSKEESWLNTLFKILTAVCLIGTFIMIFKFDKYWENVIVHKPNGYEVPKLSDLLYIFYTLPILIFVKIVFEKKSSNFMYFFLSKKYKNPMDKENFKLGQVYKKKLATNLFKVFYYTSIVIIGHFILKDMGFFPKELLGNGTMTEMFKEGVPNYLFFNKPNYFNTYYLTGLSFVITDLIWLIFVYENQSDFYLMLLHHSITISLVIFSYLTNLSQIGVIVFYLHDITDIFVYITRIVINTDYKDWIKLVPCVLLLLNYLFYRIYLFGKLILVVYWYLNDWNPYPTILWWFMCILMVMHIYWVTQIIMRFVHYKIEDVGKVNKQENKNK